MKRLIIDDWKLEASTYELLVDCGISLSDVKEISKEDLDVIFPLNRTGEKIRFRLKLRNWNESVLFQSPQEGCSTRLNFSKSQVAAKDLQKILETNEKGKIISKYYDTYNSLHPSLRKHLSEIICDSYIANEQSFNVHDMQKYSELIATRFPSEDKETYFCGRDKTISKTNPSGLLYNRYYNCRDRKSLLPKQSKKRKLNDHPAATPTIDLQYSEADKAKYKEDQAWLANNNIPLEDVTTRWKRTCAFRCNSIKNNKLSFLQVLEHWPRYQDVEGPLYLDIDYIYLYGDRNGLFVQWQSFIERLVDHAKRLKSSKEETFLELLEKISQPNVSPCSRNYLVYKLFPYIVKPKRVSRKVLPTILQAQNDCVVHCITANDIGPTLESLRKSKDGLQPHIIVVGPDPSELNQFYIAKNTVLWKSCSFLKCVDIIVKSCAVFDLKYSPYNELFWVFIRSHFYKERSIKYSKCSALIALQNILEQ